MDGVPDGLNSWLHQDNRVQSKATYVPTYKFTIIQQVLHDFSVPYNNI